MKYIYLLSLLLVLPYVYADYCFNSYLENVHNISEPCYINSTGAFCIPYKELTGDNICTVYFEGYVNSIYKPKGLCEGKLDRELKNTSGEVVFQINRIVDTIYQNVTKIEKVYIDRVIEKNVTVYNECAIWSNNTVYIEKEVKSDDSYGWVWLIVVLSFIVIIAIGAIVLW